MLLPSRRWAHAHILPEKTTTNLVQYHVIIIPGNPGISSFYLPFAAQLHQRLNGQVSVRAMNLAGFTASDHLVTVTHGGASHGDTSGPAASHSHVVERPLEYSLQEQCAYLTEYLQTLRLQLECADELARGVPQPKNAALDLNFLLSSQIRAASSVLPRRQHRFILVPHSIGCYLTLATMTAIDIINAQSPPLTGNAIDVLQRYYTPSAATATSTPTPQLPLPRVDISHSFLLFPFIRMDLSTLEYYALKLLLSPVLTLFGPVFKRMLPWLLAKLPLSAWRVLLRLAAKITASHAVLAVMDTYTNPHLVANALHFAKTEFEDVRHSAPAGATAAQRVGYFDHTSVARHRTRLTLWYAGASYDMWGPLTQRSSLLNEIPGLDARVEPTALHAWCAYEDQSTQMAKHLVHDIERLRLRWMVEGADLSGTLASGSEKTSASATTLVPSRL